MYALMNSLSNGHGNVPAGSSSNVMAASNMHALHAHSNMMNGNSFMNNMAMNPMNMSALNTSQPKSNLVSMPTHQNLHVHQSPMSAQHMMQQVNHVSNHVNTSSVNLANTNNLVNDIPEEDLPLPKFHEVFAFAMHKNGLKRGFNGAGKSGNLTFDMNKRGKMDHNPGEETSG